jgi:S-formylglutathione hydrolase
MANAGSIDASCPFVIGWPRGATAPRPVKIAGYDAPDGRSRHWNDGNRVGPSRVGVVVYLDSPPAPSGEVRSPIPLHSHGRTGVSKAPPGTGSDQEQEQDSMMETISEQRCFDGTQGFYRHQSEACAGPMTFAVYAPPQAAHGKVPVLYYLAGLTCTPETFPIKAGAQRVASELGLMLVAPDTSPRDTGIEGATDDWEFGEAASFYVDATQAPWSTRFRMETYIVDELRTLVEKQFPADSDRCGIMGHSMGGHGALTLALRHPGRYQSLSALAPISAPTRVPWGERKIFIMYLGPDREEWKRHDACELLRAGSRFDGTILVDQGEEDPFLTEQLRPDLLEQACGEAGQPLTLRMQPGYDHSYWFVQSFIEDHLRHHAGILRG